MNHILNGYFQFLLKTQFIVYFECFLGTFGAFFRFAVLIILKQRIIILDTEESNSGQLDVENYNSLRRELLISATRITNFYFRPSTKLLNSLWEKREYLLNWLRNTIFVLRECQFVVAVKNALAGGVWLTDWRPVHLTEWTKQASDWSNELRWTEGGGQRGTVKGGSSRTFDWLF